MDQLTIKERQEAKGALINWFISQNIPPADGAMIMLATIADQLTAKTLDLDELELGAKDAFKILCIEIADFVRHKKGKVK